LNRRSESPATESASRFPPGDRFRGIGTGGYFSSMLGGARSPAAVLVRGAVGTGVDGTGAAIGAITDSLMMSSSSATSAFRVGGWDYPYGYYGYDYYPYNYYGYGGYGYYDDPGYGYHYGSRSRNLRSLRSR